METSYLIKEQESTIDDSHLSASLPVEGYFFTINMLANVSSF